MTEAQKCLYHIAENMRMDKSISKEGYEYFQQAIKALEQESIIDKIRAEIEQVSFTHNFEYGEYYGEDTRQEHIVNFDAVMRIIDKYREREGEE